MPLEVELHAHTSDDPQDLIPHSALDLIDRAAALGYHALAITLHDHQLDVEPIRGHAAARGIVLIPCVERTIGQCSRRGIEPDYLNPSCRDIASFCCH